MTCCFR